MLRLPGTESIDPLKPWLTTMPIANTPTVALRLMYESALTLGVHPDESLSVHPSLEQYIGDDADSVMLQNIIHQSQHGPLATTYPRFNVHQGDLGTCYETESRIFKAIEHGLNQDQSLQSLRIIVDTAGLPLILQKNADNKGEGIRSGLTLHDLTIGDTTWPAGHLVHIRSTHRVKHEEPISIIGSDEVTSLGVLRAAAFALPIGERQAFINDPTEAEAYKQKLARTSMAEIRSQVEQIVSLA